ncbi:2-oxoglutarate dependent dioxygenase ftmF [Aspergillus brunneoviolaceus CBS 621.78]|uniref:Uncharacterized protein n=1 Tax=Aspergillus brunneoviolaceus CBS 621.78 TaxID=1450534 RepID=A0ACD1GBQ9_9EURO|nr:hypothetical protein BO95DRAFT_361202 [Aspergillus brunneoviolaceus CBS 621.78]RAH46615.1 hypothetical protein BO95DRAFT_361202 [Aspergillus brunneoviolaceus CBS 621.78]
MSSPETANKPSIRRFPATTPPQTLWQAVCDDGAAIIEGFLPGPTIEKFDQELSHRSATTTGGQMNQEFYQMPVPTTTKWMNDLTATCPTFRHEILNNPVLHRLCEEVFTRTHGDYWLLNGMAMEMMPGNPTQELHNDHGTHPILQYLADDAPSPVFSIITAVNEFTEANGATRVILGSHRWPMGQRGTDEQTVRAVLQPGDALVLYRTTKHGGAAHGAENPDHRRLLLLSVGSCQLAPYETHVTVPRAVVESMTPLAQKMIGWRSTKPVISNVTGLNTVRMKHLETQIGLRSEVPLEGEC